MARLVARGPRVTQGDSPRPTANRVAWEADGSERHTSSKAGESARVAAVWAEMATSASTMPDPRMASTKAACATSIVWSGCAPVAAISASMPAGVLRNPTC